MMKTMVIGANGQLGSDICEVFGKKHQVHGLTHAEGDISDYAAMLKLFDGLSPDIVINTAAMHNVEACEKDAAKAYAVNGIGVKNLAELCRQGDIPFIHISTDYVFDGKKGRPYVETDAAMPLNVYGNTKLSGENYALSIWPKTAVMRVGAIYGKNPCRAKGGLNFVGLMLKLAGERPFIRVVDDEIVTPTPTMAIAEQALVLTENEKYGLFHATCQGQCSWYEFAKTIFEIAGVKTDLQKAKPGKFPAKVRRPMFSVLENKRLAEMELDIMSGWKDGLEKYIIKKGTN